MKASLFVFTLIALFFFASTSNALPQFSSDVVLGRRNIEQIIPELQKRSGHRSNSKAPSGHQWQKKEIPTLATEIMVQIKAKVKASLLIDISTKFCDDIKASLHVSLKALLGIVEIDDAKIALAQKTVVNGLDGKEKTKILYGVPIYQVFLYLTNCGFKFL
jgi:hypothetical protein